MRISMCFFLILLLSITPMQAAPDVNAQAAILMDAKTGRVLWEKNSDKPMAMASTTKIMTAILALESGKTNEIVTVSKTAAAAPKMKMHLSAGEKIRLYDLLLALMLESSNDAAVAIAEHLAGSVPAFCALMTQKAEEMGAKDTIFETPSGLDAGDHHSTAYDLAMITRYALNMPDFIQLTNTSNASFSSDKRSYSKVNKNRLLNEYPGGNGVKTGFTTKAGHCFVGAAKRDDMQLISVVLASGWGDKGRAQKWIDTKAVLNYGFENFKYETIVEERDQAGVMGITRSRTGEVKYVYAKSLTISLSPKDNVEVKVVAPSSKLAPIAQGDILGTAEVYLNGQLYTSIDLLATESAARHDLKTSMEKVLNQWLSQVINEPVSIILPEF